MDRQIYALTAGTPLLTSVMPMQVSDGSAEAKKITLQQIKDLTGELFSVKVHVTSAELLAIQTTPKVIVANQGANTLIVPVIMIIKYNFATAAYTSNLNLNVGSASFPTLIAANGILGNTADAIAMRTASINTTATGYTLDEALRLSCASGNPAGGDASVDVFVSYKVFNLS